MRAALLTIAPILIVSASASAQFKLDMTADDVNARFDVRMISDLAVNESSYMEYFDAGFCAQDGRLFIDGHSELAEPSRWDIRYSVRRLTGDRVEIGIAVGLESTRRLENIGFAIEYLEGRGACGSARLRRPQARFFSVRTVDGYDTLSEIVADHLENVVRIEEGADRSTATADAATPDAGPTPSDWADDRYPDIDYSASPFFPARAGSADVIGHWIVYEDTAELDDSPRIRAKTFGPSVPNGADSWFHLECVENETRVFLTVDDRLSVDHRTFQAGVEFRIGDQPARSERWTASTSRQHAGLWNGAPSENMIRALLGEESIFIRVSDNRNRQQQDRFDIRGVDDVAERVAAACGWSTLALTRADYLEIQQNLRRLGFYSGAIDRAWGPMSQAAMREFQEANGLAVTGAPGQDSLNMLRE